MDLLARRKDGSEFSVEISLSYVAGLSMAFVSDITMLKISERREMAMARIHEQLYNHHDMSPVDLTEYIQGLAAGLFSSDSPSAAITHSLEGAPTRLTKWFGWFVFALI